MGYLKGKILLPVLYGATLVTANITAVKVASFDFPFLGDVAIPAGFAAIGIAFLFTDLIGEFYGEELAKHTVNSTVVALAFAWLMVYVSIIMPSAPFYELGDEFAMVMDGGAVIILASIITTLVSQNLDVRIFHFIRSKTGDGHKWMRNIFSTGSSQLIDTALFIVLGFAILPHLLGGEVTPWSVIPIMIIGQYMAKLAIALLETPIFYLVTWYHES